MSQLLILVHPGSLCGSADFNLGRQEAKIAREKVMDLLKSWTASILVLDGELSDELLNYPQLNVAIEGVLHRARKMRLAHRAAAPDPDHPSIALQILERSQFKHESQIVIAGAWHDEHGDVGCVNSTRDALVTAGYKSVQISQACAAVPYCEEDIAPSSSCHSALRHRA